MERMTSGRMALPDMFRVDAAMRSYLAGNCDEGEMSQPPAEVCEAYGRYLHLPELAELQRQQLWPNWKKEALVRPALHSLEMIFRLISSLLFDSREYIDKDEWLRRLEALANTQLELISHICEGDNDAPTMKQQTMSTGWQKNSGPRASAPLRSSQKSLLPRMATWKRAQSAVTRLHFAIEGHMLRVPWTLGLGEPNLSGKPVLDYDKVCTPLEVYNYRHVVSGYHEDHALVTAHQILESWLVVAQGLVRDVEESIGADDPETAAKKCWILERVWKLFTSTMDLLQVMDPDDFMRLKQELSMKPSGSPSCGVAFCLRSTMMRTVTRACRELRRFVPRIVGVEADPKGGPRLQEAVMEIFKSHGLRSKGKGDQPYSYQIGSIHLLQAFQAVEAAIRQFYFTYQQLVITVMGSGDYKGSVQAESSGADVLFQLYSEPPYFPSVDGARTFLGDFWHQQNVIEERLSMRQAVVNNNGKSISSSSSFTNDSDEEMPNCTPADYQRAQRQILEEAVKSTSRVYRQPAEV